MLSYCFEVFLGKFTENFFLVKNLTLSERISEILGRYFFLRIEKGQIQRKIWNILNNFFWSNQYKGTNINKNCFFPQNEPHTDKLCLPFVLKHFQGMSLITSLFSQNKYVRKKFRNIQKGCFSQQVWKGANPKENRICCK